MPNTQAIMLLAVTLCTAAPLATVATTSTQEPTEERSVEDQGERSSDSFHRVRREGAVVIREEYDTSDLRIPVGEIHELLPRDAIPALTDPKLEDARYVSWLRPDDRVIEVTVGEEAVALPLRVMEWHEVANIVVGGEPIAATYCPLCDSVTVFSRRVQRRTKDGTIKDEVLEFGVSGALYNSNVLLYDRTEKALWSQLSMQAVSGPRAGYKLKHRPVRVVTFEQFKSKHFSGKVVSKDTGHDRDYSGVGFEEYMQSPELAVPVAGVGDAMPPKTLGVGILSGDESWFIPVSQIEGYLVLQTRAGEVTLRSSRGGVIVLDAPEGTRTAQTFYFSWSAFYPQTRVLTGQGRPSELGRTPLH